MRKRGQFDISFGMIFSIIIIIAIIGVAFYVITNFLQTSKCAEIGLFYDDLRKDIDKAWEATKYRDSFTGTLSSGVEMVCFGDSSQTPGEYKKEFDELVRGGGRGHNVFISPKKEACDVSLASIKLEHAKTDQFFCVNVNDKKLSIKMEKNVFDSLVSIKK